MRYPPRRALNAHFTKEKTMGRPIKKKFFGNTNVPPVGGEGVATIAKNNTGTLYSTSTTLALTFTAPQVAGGAAAAGTVTTNEVGNVATVTLTSAGSGYTSTPTATVVGGTTGTTATFVVTLTSTNQNALDVTARITGGTALKADIIKQESSVRYLVRNADGTDQCKLVAVASGSLAEKQMNLVATDSLGSTYYVTKLTARRARLTQASDGGSGFEFLSGSVAGWTLGSATTGVVSLASL